MFLRKCVLTIGYPCHPHLKYKHVIVFVGNQSDYMIVNDRTIIAENVLLVHNRKWSCKSKTSRI